MSRLHADNYKDSNLPCNVPKERLFCIERGFHNLMASVSRRRGLETLGSTPGIRCQAPSAKLLVVCLEVSASCLLSSVSCLAFFPCLRCRVHAPGSWPVPASSGVALPPLECLFTVQEEVGLLGAFALDASMIKGRTLLNLVSSSPPILLLSLTCLRRARLIGACARCVPPRLWNSLNAA